MTAKHSRFFIFLSILLILVNLAIIEFHRGIISIYYPYVNIEPTNYLYEMNSNYYRHLDRVAEEMGKPITRDNIDPNDIFTLCVYDSIESASWTYISPLIVAIIFALTIIYFSIRIRKNIRYKIIAIVGTWLGLLWAYIIFNRGILGDVKNLLCEYNLISCLEKCLVMI